MQRWTTYTLRAVFIIGFLIVLPVMAMPSVAKLLDGLLYGEPEKSVPTTGAEPAPAPSKSVVAEASQATHEVPLSADGTALPDELGSHGLAERFPVAPPPPLQRAPDFLPRGEGPAAGESATPAADVGPLDQATANQIDAVRGRLEELGAEYVRLEMSEDGRTFHCLCDMLLGGEGNKTQPFEATRNDPVAAVRAVLTNVEAWRNAERTPARGTKSGPQSRTR
ncbi:MAG: hypothetical protein K8R36_25675 [Planctomycetales bacterium]|nr:hypothetical protein [Planctomycetales bacterium]